MKVSKKFICLVIALVCAGVVFAKKPTNKPTLPNHYLPYLEFLDQVYQAMEKEYHFPVSRALYKEYRRRYKESVLSQLPPIEHKITEIAYRGAGLLVMQLRHPNDTFTNFIPPREAREFVREAYGHRHDIGITGNLIETGFLIEKVEIRSDSYAQGIRPKQLILEIEGKKTINLDSKAINRKLTPELGETVKLKILDQLTEKTADYEILSKEYYRETIEKIAIDVDHIYCLAIRSFNKKTAQDLKWYLENFSQNQIDLLILDIRGNPGGPPLAIREIAGFFFPPETKLAYYQKRTQIVGGLLSPESDITYKGPLALLIDQQSGSSSELFAAILKEYNRGQIIGNKPTPGFTFLKGTAEFDDGSMLIMATGFAYLFNGQPLGFDGIYPTYTPPENTADIIRHTVKEFKKGSLFSQNGKPKTRQKP